MYRLTLTIEDTSWASLLHALEEVRSRIEPAVGPADAGLPWQEEKSYLLEEEDGGDQGRYTVSLTWSEST